MTDLAAQLEQANNNVKGLSAQLEASKQMCNEFIQSSFNLRASNVILQQSAQESAAKMAELDKQIESQKNQLAVLSAQIIELTKPALVEVPEPDAA